MKIILKKKTPNFTLLGVKLGVCFVIYWFSRFIAEREGLRLCHSLLLAAGAIAKMVKLTALRLFVLFCTSPLQEQTPDGLARKKPGALRWASLLCGEGGIRTPGTSPFNGFQDRRNRPLCHLSSPCKTLVCFVWDCKGRYFFLFCNFYLLKTTRFLFFSNEWKIIVMLFVINFFWNNTHRVLIIVI